MKFEDFIIALQEAGWETVHSHREEVKWLHADIWPVIAELEETVEVLVNRDA